MCYTVKKQLRRAVALLFCILMCFVITAPVLADELTDEQKKTLDEQVEHLKSRKQEITATKDNIAEINAQIREIEETIASLDARMADTQAELNALQAQYDQQLKELEERLRVMYMYGDDGYIEMLFNAKDFAELLTRIDMIRSVMQSDRDCVNAIRKTEKEIEAGIAELKADKANAQVLKDQQALLLANNQALLAAQELEYAKEKELSDKIAKELGLVGIDAYMSELEWPFDQGLENAFRLSSWFGSRDSTGVESTDHKGWDLIPEDGVDILACASGVVVKAEYYGGYGNCVVIEHGKSYDGKVLHTLYGHMSSVSVSVGESVSQGQKLGVIGSTGNSTGTHLHLEVWENKEPVDPWNYFKKYENKIYHY